MTTDTTATSTSVETQVDAPIERAFEVFTIGIGSWWDRDKHILPAPLARMEFQPWVGGNIIDHGTDGSASSWSRVLVYEPPHRVVFSWDITPQWQIETDPAKASEVEITFRAVTPERTRVVLTHRHLDRHGDGWEGMRDAVSSGWSLDGLIAVLHEPAPFAWIGDDEMRSRLARSAAYTVVVLLPTERLVRPQVDPIIWAHGRRNMALMAAGIAPVITPVTVPEGPSGFAIFTTDTEQTRTIMDADPGVLAGVFIYEIHPARGFPGATLP
ncbi:MAG: Activator of Hsp90 ATPase 1 family protein [Ilumatobacteraceae bacterium]|nr:Activator of Hsp90 ATPase 1 family protein [Ilumatobacteraceae bacterium]